MQAWAAWLSPGTPRQQTSIQLQSPPGSPPLVQSAYKIHPPPPLSSRAITRAPTQPAPCQKNRKVTLEAGIAIGQYSAMP
eukprot:5276584-Amphidinium_carterae.1